MEFKLSLSEEALSDIERHKKSGNKLILRKLERILNELVSTPFNGTGKPEPLKYHLPNYWSRRLKDKHRLEY